MRPLSNHTDRVLKLSMFTNDPSASRRAGMRHSPHHWRQTKTHTHIHWKKPGRFVGRNIDSSSGISARFLGRCETLVRGETDVQTRAPPVTFLRQSSIDTRLDTEILRREKSAKYLFTLSRTKICLPHRQSVGVIFFLLFLFFCAFAVAVNVQIAICARRCRCNRLDMYSRETHRYLFCIHGNFFWFVYFLDTCISF